MASILVPISAKAYKKGDADYFGAIEYSIDKKEIIWKFDATEQKREPAELYEEDGILKFRGFRPSGIERKENGETVVAGWNNFLKLDPSGKIIGNISRDEFNDIHEINVTDRGTYLITSTGYDTIIEMNPMFHIIWEWHMWEEVGTIGEIYYPEKTYSDSNSDYVYSPDNRYHLNYARHIDEDKILASALNYGVMQIDKESGKVVESYREVNECHNPYYDEDNNELYVAESGLNRCIRLEGPIREEIYSKNLNFSKDFDKIGENRFLITDTKNDRVLIIEDGEKTFELELPKGARPFEASYLTEKSME